MQNSGLCKNLAGFSPAVHDRRQNAAEKLAASARNASGAEEKKNLARDFSEVFYTIVVKEMRKAINRPEQDSVADGVSGFIDMFLPQSMAGCSSDPLTKYFYDHLITQFGENIDEGA